MSTKCLQAIWLYVWHHLSSDYITILLHHHHLLLLLAVQLLQVLGEETKVSALQIQESLEKTGLLTTVCFI